ncbi:MAG: NAD(P)H-dependent glycerol-3-phosphate dehydrogenase [Clostridia bacterium]|nr:NAD(P)H-dependent glycerol-3-phosphate dehydrogenase [Clostridia bacterium]
MVNTITVVGAGSWGTAVSLMLAKKGYDIKLWVYETEVYEYIKLNHENHRYLPGVVLPKNIIVSNRLDSSTLDSEIIVLAVPSHVIRSICKQIKKYVTQDKIIVNLAKGIETDTLMRMSEVINQEIPNSKLAIISGPSHAEEVAKDIPTAVVVSSADKAIAECIQDIFMCSNFRVYTNPDIVGVELGGSLKNIVAIGAGMCDGLGYGDNTRAALITRGIAEIARLGSLMGAHTRTFSGLSGIGDLIVTCNSMHSRNRRAGIKIAQGKSLKQMIEEIGMVVEGVKTTEAAYKLSKMYCVEMPITQEIYNVLFRSKKPEKSGVDLMMRNKKHEIEQLVFGESIEW